MVVVAGEVCAGSARQGTHPHPLPPPPSRASDLSALLVLLRPFFDRVAKAKTAKLVRSVLDGVAAIPGKEADLLALCEAVVEWAGREKRNFLRLRTLLRQGCVLLKMGRAAASLAVLAPLLREAKRLDDKALLVEAHLLEAQDQHALANGPKARAALTACRSAAASLYVAPDLQAEIDGTAGALHAEERDYRTAFSYFFEAYEGLHSLGSKGAVVPLKHMLLCKVLQGEGGDVAAIVAGKPGLAYPGTEVEAIKAVAAAVSARSLALFDRAMAAFPAELEGDPFAKVHLARLAGELLQSNLLRLLEPFSRVEIAHVAALIDLPAPRVEAMLSSMILDKKFAGTLDQGNGVLLVFEKTEPDVRAGGGLRGCAAWGGLV